uniref:Uncharacterized protein n=1 Tax=Arundo donax TaxID=35708 RepID=A0A0A9GW55_ARUDO
MFIFCTGDQQMRPPIINPKPSDLFSLFSTSRLLQLRLIPNSVEKEIYY